MDTCIGNKLFSAGIIDLGHRIDVLICSMPPFIKEGCLFVCFCVCVCVCVCQVEMFQTITHPLCSWYH